MLIERGTLATLRRYGFLGSLRLIRDLILSKFVSHQVRLIRYPIIFAVQEIFISVEVLLLALVCVLMHLVRNRIKSFLGITSRWGIMSISAQ